MLIIEGGDNVGKSTLVKQLLALDSTLRVVKRQKFDPEAGESIGASYINALIDTDDRYLQSNSIADRMVASEIIYGDLFRKGHRLDLGEHLALDLILVAYNAMVVLCCPPDETIKATWEKRNQLYDDPTLIAHSYNARINSIFPLNEVWRYDWTLPDSDYRRITIAKKHRDKQIIWDRQLSWWSAHPYGVGQLSLPSVLIVGEAPSPKAVTPAPFAHGPAGDFLAWALALAEKRTKRVDPLLNHIYITNADKGGRDASLLREEIRFLGPHRIVALGNEATELVREVDGEKRLRSLPHPMFWKRFRWERRSEYVTKLVHAIYPLRPRE